MSISALLLNRQKNRQLLALATPMILSNITIPLLGLVDTAVIGHLGQAYSWWRSARQYHYHLDDLVTRLFTHVHHRAGRTSLRC